MRYRANSVLATAVLVLGCSTSGTSDVCTSGDLDGIVGGSWTFALVATDSEFSPLILKAQNSSTIVLSLENRGERPHDFHVDCLATPNDDGCPLQSCFPAEATIPSVAPGEKASAMFFAPRVEGIYSFRSSLPDDQSLEGQFVVQ